MSPSQHENEHPNFIKKYSAKKVRLLFSSTVLESDTDELPHPIDEQFFKASTAMRKWAEEEYRPMEFYGRDGKVTREVVPALLS